MSPTQTVSPMQLIRWSGLGPMLAGLALVLFPLLHPNHDPAGYKSALWVPAHFMPSLAAILTLFGLFGLLARQLQRAGWLGVVAFVVAVVGTSLLLTAGMLEMFIFPYLGEIRPTWEEEPPPAGIVEAFLAIKATLTLGYVLVGAAIVRAGVLPRSAGVLLAVSTVAFNFGDPVLMALGLEAAWGLPFALFGVGLAWFGYGLWTSASERRAVRVAPRSVPVVG